MFSFQPRLVSIGLLLAILIISLMFSSYVEGAATMEESANVVNQNAPKGPAEAPAAQTSNVKASNDSNAVVLGNLSVSDVTGMLKNNAGVQKLIDQRTMDQKPK